MKNKIFVIYPEDEEEEKPQKMLYAKKKWVKGEIDLTQTEKDLKSLITMFENLEKTGSKYNVEEAKLTVGLIKDEKGNLHASIGANVLSLVKGKISGEMSEKVSENKLFEIKIKRKTT